MTVNSLVNFGVPGLKGERSAPLQPIIGNKFRVIFHEFAGMTTPYILTQQVRKAELPRLSFTLKENAGGEYEADDTKWEYSRITFLDEITGSLFKSILKQGKLQSEQGSLFKMDIELLNNIDIIRRYSYSGCSLVSVDPVEDLDYSVAEGLQFELCVRYEDVVALIPVVKFEGFEQL